MHVYRSFYLSNILSESLLLSTLFRDELFGGGYTCKCLTLKFSVIKAAFDNLETEPVAECFNICCWLDVASLLFKVCWWVASWVVNFAHLPSRKCGNIPVLLLVWRLLIFKSNNLYWCQLELLNIFENQNSWILSFQAASAGRNCC